MSSDEKPFWEVKALDDMSDSEWESLCDGCGRCCLQKLEDEDTGQIHFTRISCRLLDTNSCQCSDYSNRFDEVPDCLSVRPITAEKLSWLPVTCAYRKLSQGQGLDNWHPLVSGDPESVKLAGISVSGRCISEQFVPLSEIYSHIIELHNDSST